MSSRGFYLIQLWTCHNSRHWVCGGAPNWRICQWSSGNFKAWWTPTYVIVLSWGVDLIQLWTCHNSRHWICGDAPNWKICQGNSGNFKGVPLFMWLFRVRVFTWFYYGLVTIQNISVTGVPQIGEFTNGIRETSKLRGIGFIRHLMGSKWSVYLIQLWTSFDSQHFNYKGSTNWRIFQLWNTIYLNVPSGAFKLYYGFIIIQEILIM